MRVKKINKTNEIRKHLERYKSLDQITAFQLYKCGDLASAIRRLRNKGLRIECISGSGYINTR